MSLGRWQAYNRAKARRARRQRIFRVMERADNGENPGVLKRLARNALGVERCMEEWGGGRRAFVELVLPDGYEAFGSAMFRENAWQKAIDKAARHRLGWD